MKPEHADMPKSFLRMFLGAGLMLTGCSVATLLALPPDRPEFILSICNIFIGLTLVLGVLLAARRLR